MLEVFAVGIADDHVDRLGEQQRAQVPKVLARPNLLWRPCRTARPRGRGQALLPNALVPLVARQWTGLPPVSMTKRAIAVDEIGVAVDCVFLAVQPGLAVRHRVDEPPALHALATRGSACPKSSDIFISSSSVAAGRRWG